MKIHSYLSKSCEIKVQNSSKGVFAKKMIQKNDLIAIWGGIIYSDNELIEMGKVHPHLLTHPVSVFEGFYLGPSNLNQMDDVEFMNHSCNPNVGIKGQIILVARRNILPGEEVCFDYETTETNQESFLCNCGEKNCRKKITGNAWKNKSFQKKNKGFFSWYIEEKIKRLNKSKLS